MKSSASENLDKISRLVEPAIVELLGDGIDLRNQPAALHQCASGGKRIRPGILVATGLFFGADIKDLIYPAASVEIIHNATLITDDIIDHADLRRNELTTWKKYGQSIAECMSLEYLGSAFDGLSRSVNGPELTRLCGRTIRTIVDGEIDDILFERFGHEDESFVMENRFKTITIDDYLEMIRKKTAVLIQACCIMGAIVAGASDEHRQIITEFGHNLGQAFQIRDDILDVFGNAKKFGKQIGKDIIEKKMGNILLLKATDQLNGDDKARLIQILQSPEEVTADIVTEVIALINKTQAAEQAEELAEGYISKALDIFKKLPQNEHSQDLIDLANYIVCRNV